jgi:hypothetical protein
MQFLCEMEIEAEEFPYRFYTTMKKDEYYIIYPEFCEEVTEEKDPSKIIPIAEQDISGMNLSQQIIAEKLDVIIEKINRDSDRV